MLWERGEPPATCELRANMRWDAPALMLLDTGAAVVDSPRDSGPSSPQAHWLTPETARTTHYFWAIARDRFVGDVEIGAQLTVGFDSAFRNEDEPMIEAVQSNMGGVGLWDLGPVLLSTYNAAVRARRIVDNLIAAEVVV
jgi:Vanillate O-demethylase oxygenase C-terminal domain